jgi:hypothetical protein
MRRANGSVAFGRLHEHPGTPNQTRAGEAAYYRDLFPDTGARKAISYQLRNAVLAFPGEQLGL